MEDFKTFYFKPGFETLVPLASFLEEKFNVEIGIGSDFLNIYTARPELIQRIERAIRRWKAVAPHVELDPIEHGGGK